MICVLRQGEPSPCWGTVLAEARQDNAVLWACHVRNRDLAHYGQVDMLAPASAMSEFVDYVRELNQEEAEQAFAPLLRVAAEQGVQVRVVSVEGDKGLARFKAEMTS